jgi:hypothetical protein
MAILLAGGTATGAMAAVTSVSAPPAVQSTPVPPGAPTGLTPAPGNGTATLSWSAPSSDGGSPIDFYVIQGGTSPSDDILAKVGGHTTTTTIAGLTNGTVYFLSVHAQNAFGDGPAVTVQVTPQAAGSGTGAGTAPGAPTGLKTSYGDGFIALSWSPPASAGSSPVTGYHVYMGFSSSFTAAREFTTTGPRFRLTDAENGSTYFIKVTAVNAAGEGPATPATSVIPDPPTAPSAPTGLTVRAGHGEATLSWSPPPGGLKDGDGYLIYMGTSPGGEGAKPSYPHLIENATSFTIAPLTNGTRYYFQVARLDGNNQVSARSAEVSAVPVAAAGSGSGSSASNNGTQTGPGGGVATQPATPPPRHGKNAIQHDATSSPPGGLIIVLAALSLAATGGAIAIVLIQRRRKGRSYPPVPAPRRPYDDQPDSPFSRAGQSSQSGREQELNGPRYR